MAFSSINTNTSALDDAFARLRLSPENEINNISSSSSEDETIPDSEKEILALLDINGVLVDKHGVEGPWFRKFYEWAKSQGYKVGYWTTKCTNTQKVLTKAGLMDIEWDIALDRASTIIHPDRTHKGAMKKIRQKIFEIELKLAAYNKVFNKVRVVDEYTDETYYELKDLIRDMKDELKRLRDELRNPRVPAHGRLKCVKEVRALDNYKVYLFDDDPYKVESNLEPREAIIVHNTKTTTLQWFMRKMSVL